MCVYIGCAMLGCLVRVAARFLPEKRLTVTTDSAEELELVDTVDFRLQEGGRAHARPVGVVALGTGTDPLLRRARARLRRVAVMGAGIHRTTRSPDGAADDACSASRDPGRAAAILASRMEPQTEIASHPRPRNTGTT